MKKASLKFKKYASNLEVMDSLYARERILKGMLYCFAILALCYVFILGNMVFDIVERRALEKEALALSNEVGSLELQYLALSNKIDLEMSYALGFKETKPKFAIREAVGFNNLLSLKQDNEI